MSRRRKESEFEYWIDVAAMLPWQVNVLLAVVIYFVLHHYATAGIASPATIVQLGSYIVSQSGKTLALFGQYLLPTVCIIGAVISFYRRSKRTQMFENVSASKSVAALNGVSWRDFEILVGEAFRRGGYSVVETGGGGADGGVDLVLRKDGEKFLVQCKQWKALKVGVTTIRELYGVMAAAGAVGGFVVTSGVFTQEAKDFASGRNIDLIDGADLYVIIKQVQPVSAQEENITGYHTKIMSMTGQLCPKCGSLMVMRTAKQGANAGNQFWGCSKFPQCRGFVPANAK